METSISREKAKAIMTSLGLETEYDPLGDYYLGEFASVPGSEALFVWGDEMPIAANTGNTSWTSPGFPSE